MANEFLINMSGESIPVYDDPDKTRQIGSIYHREAYGYNKNWGGDRVINHICFLGPDGYLHGGFIIDTPVGGMTDCIDYPYGTETINGERFYTFIMRKSRTIYTRTGDVWGTVAEGRRVACRTAMSGDTNPHWKGINYVEGADGEWIAVTGDNVQYGFVDTGLDYASGYASIPFYGSW